MLLLTGALPLITPEHPRQAATEAQADVCRSFVDELKSVAECISGKLENLREVEVIADQEGRMPEIDRNVEQQGRAQQGAAGTPREPREGNERRGLEEKICLELAVICKEKQQQAVRDRKST